MIERGVKNDPEIENLGDQEDDDVLHSDREVQKMGTFKRKDHEFCFRHTKLGIVMWSPMNNRIQEASFFLPVKLSVNNQV